MKLEIDFDSTRVFQQKIIGHLQSAKHTMLGVGVEGK